MSYGPPRKASLRFKLAMAAGMLLFVAEMTVLFLQSIEVIP